MVNERVSTVFSFSQMSLLTVICTRAPFSIFFVFFYATNYGAIWPFLPTSTAFPFRFSICECVVRAKSATDDCGGELFANQQKLDYNTRVCVYLFVYWGV